MLWEDGFDSNRKASNPNPITLIPENSALNVSRVGVCVGVWAAWRHLTSPPRHSD